MKKLFLYLFCMLSAIVCAAQQIDITAQQVPHQGAFAQPFDVRFEMDHTPGYTVELDTQSLPKDFELTAQDKQILSPGTVAYDLSFIPFTLGRSTFTAVNLLLTDHNGQTVAQTSSTDVPVDIQPVKLFEDNQMHDIRPPYIPTSWFWWLMCAALLAAILYGIYYFWKRLHSDKYSLDTAQMPDNRPADVIALSKIQLLLQSGLWETAQYKLFYIELGDILREYFWRRFQLDVSADTSAELLRRARGEAKLASSLAILRDYLNSADLVKFAKVIPQEDTMQKDIQAVQTVVKNTAPSPVTNATQEEK